MAVPTWVEIVSKLATPGIGAISAFYVFLQYKRAQRWKATDLAATLLERLHTDQALALACQALDWGVGPLIIPDQYRPLFRSGVSAEAPAVMERRVFSSAMRAEDGFVIDMEGQVPEVYAERQATSEFEKDLWKRFWDLANDEKLAKERGVRAIHGDAPYMRLEPDRVYEICLRSTGEVIITPGTRMAPPPAE